MYPSSKRFICTYDIESIIEILPPSPDCIIFIVSCRSVVRVLRQQVTHHFVLVYFWQITLWCVMTCTHWHSLLRYMEAKGRNTWGYLCALFHVPETYCDLFSWTTQSCRILRSIMFNDYNNYLISNDSTPINIQQGHGRLIHKLDLLATVLDFINTTNSDKYQAHSLLTAISKITFWTL